jgi:ATP-binding cassette subfamily F protein 3
VRSPGRAHAPVRQPAHAPAGTTTTANGSNGAAAKAKGKQKQKGPSKNRLSAQEQATLAVERAEAAMAALEQELSDPAAWASKYESAKSEARHTAARRAVEEAYARLEAVID